jgi:hypothetical protein
MRRQFVGLLLVLPLLGGCLQPDQPPAQPELIQLAIDARSSTAERARILRAVNEWNVARAGALRLDIAEASDGAPVLHADRLTGRDLEGLKLAQPGDGR